jgi:hypothetical protein
MHDATIDEEELEDDGEGAEARPEEDEEEQVEVNSMPTKLPKAIEDYIYRGDRLHNYSLY